MSNQKPPPWFDHDAEGGRVAGARRREMLKRELPQLLEEHGKDRGRAQRFYPYLLIRSVLGDRGDRPFNAPFWESPDIWTAPGDPAVSPALPADHGGTLQAGRPNTVYAHVWNLGFAPLLGVRVEFYWFNPSLAFDGAHANSIGVARCELAARGMPGSHKLIKCPTAWVPVVENGGHECLVVRVSGFGDSIGSNEWHPWQNRHVAQRNVSVVSAGASVQQLMTSLNLTRRLGTSLQLIQVGAREGALATKLVAPRLAVARIDTHLLAELTVANEIVSREPAIASAGMFAAVHPLSHNLDVAAPVLRPRDRTTQIIAPSRVLGEFRVARSAVPSAVGPSPAGSVVRPRPGRVPAVAGGPATVAVTRDIGDLLAGVEGLHAGPTLGHPSRGQAFVLRMATYDETQLVGGYTLVIGAPS